MDALCRRLENLVDQLSQSSGSRVPNEAGQASKIGSPGNSQHDLIEAAHVLRSLPQPRASRHHRQLHANLDEDIDVEGSSEDEDELSHGVLAPTVGIPRAADSTPSHAGALVRDSYGHLR